ncbi:MAG: glutamine amidotransferase-related protein [Collinsella sp.]
MPVPCGGFGQDEEEGSRGRTEDRGGRLPQGQLVERRARLARAGAAACTSDDPEQIRRADGLVIPGVGAFYDAIAFVRQSGEEAAVLDAVAAGTPLLGICLGLQLF